MNAEYKVPIGETEWDHMSSVVNNTATKIVIRRVC